MALQEAHVAFKFTGGVETKMDSKAVPPVRLLALENGVFSRASSITKRNGYSLLSRVVDGTVTPYSGAKRLAARDDEMLLFTANRCYSKQSGADQWTDAGALIAPVGSDHPAVHTSTAQTMPDRATNGGVTAYAWEDSLGGVWWTVEDELNGRIYRAPTQLDSAGERPRCVAVGDTIHIYYVVAALRRINVLVINPSSPTATVTPTLLVADLDTTNPVYDAVPTDRTGTPALITWHEHGTTNIRLGFVDAGGFLGSPSSGHPSVYRDEVTLLAGSPLAIAFLAGDPQEAVAAFYNMPTPEADPDPLTLYLQALTAGTAGNSLTMEFVADGTGAGTFEDGTAAVFHFEAGVTTGDDFIAAIAASSYFTGFASGTFGVSAVATRTLSSGVDAFTADEIATVYQTSTNMKVSFYESTRDTDPITETTTQIVSAVTTLTRIAAAYATDGSGKVWTAGEETAAEASERYTIANWATSTPTAGDAATIRSVGLASRAFQAGDTADVFAVFVHDTTYFNTYLTLRLSDFAPAGRHLPGSACGPTRTHLPSVYVDDSVATFVVPYKSRLASTNNDKFTESALRAITMDFDTEDSHQTAQLSRGLYMASACPQHYDGRLWTEQGFHVGPELIESTPAGGGSMTAESVVQYKVWYEWPDAQGEIHRGPESIGVSVTLAAGQTQVTLALPTLRVTRKSNVRICVARSLPGVTSRHWRVTSLDPTTAGAANGYVANDTTVDSVTFVDRMSDVNLQLQELIYTIGGILSNDPVPLGSHIAAGKNRLFFTDAQAGSVVRYTKRAATGFGAECAPELQHDVDPYGGDITALAVMDDIVYAFKRSCIFAFNGDGPYEDGSNASGSLVTGFSSSQIITSDVGCDDPASIVLTPKGLMFKSTKGIRLITRSREIVPIGDPVETYNAQNVRRATVMPDRTAVLFLTDSGYSLYFDYERLQWSTFTNHEGYDGVVIDNTYHYLRTNDIVFRETVGLHADGLARITLRLETAWLHILEHLQGFQRFWRLLLLGTWSSPHQLGVSYRMNYDEEWSEPYYLDATGEDSATGWITGDSADTIGADPILGSDYGDGAYGDGDYGGTGPDIYQWRYGIHENGQAVQFRFEDFEKAGLSGASFELTEMTITGGVMKPDMRPFSGARST